MSSASVPPAWRALPSCWRTPTCSWTGPFLEDQLDHSRPWVGSRNQGIRALTSRYASDADDWSAHPDRVEVTIGPDGSVALNGWADVDALDLLLTGVGGARSRAAGRRRTR